MSRKRIVVAATGASGLPILKMCLQIIKEDSDFESILILSDSAKITLQQETNDTVEEMEALADHICDAKDIGATGQWIIPHRGNADRAMQYEDSRRNP
ncbi:MAG: hypothetical protein V8R43_10290 [Dorea sp.]